MRNYVFSFITIVSLIALIGCGNNADPDPNQGAGEGADKPTITLGKAPYEHLTFINGVIQHAAEQLGYPVEITEADVGIVYQGVSTGEIDVYADAWLPVVHGQYIDRFEGEMEIIGMLYE